MNPATIVPNLGNILGRTPANMLATRNCYHIGSVSYLRTLTHPLMKYHLVACLMFNFALAFSPNASRGDEGMYLFNDLPVDLLKQR